MAGPVLTAIPSSASVFELDSPWLPDTGRLCALVAPLASTFAGAFVADAGGWVGRMGLTTSGGCGG